MELMLLALLGIGTGAYGVLVGAGGGFILGPILLLFLDLEPEVVAGTVLASVGVGESTICKTRKSGKSKKCKKSKKIKKSKKDK